MHKKTMRCSVVVLLAGAVWAGTALPVAAGGNFSFGISVGGPTYRAYGYRPGPALGLSYYRPYPLYVAPAPIVVRPAPLIYEPAPIVYPYQPSPVVVTPVPVAPAPTYTAPAPTPVPTAPPAASWQPTGPTPAVHNEDAVERRLQLLASADENVRSDAALELGRMRADRAVDRLTAVLAGDRSPTVRDAAARALGLIGERRALPALQRAAQADGDRDVRRSAQFAVEVITTSLRRN